MNACFLPVPPHFLLSTFHFHSMINIITRANNISLTSTIEAYLFKKLEVLERYIDPKDSGVQAQVELEKTTDHHASGKIYRAEINLQCAMGDFRAEHTAEDLYEAIDAAKDEIVRVVAEFKEKKVANARKGARVATEMLREEE